MTQDALAFGTPLPGGEDESLLTLAEISELIDSEESDCEDIIHLTANETVLSPRAQSVLASDLGSRYLFEHLDMRQNSPSRLGNILYRGLDRVNKIERSAAIACRRMFGADYVEFRCLSGLHAMQTTIAALSRPGDTIMRLATKDGGHFLTELLCKQLGRESCTFVYDDTGQVDVARTEAVLANERPVLIYIDSMTPLFPFPLGDIRMIAGDIPIVYDASHTLGLIAGGRFQDPLREGADILQANTHKTFFGPQKGIVMGNSERLMDRISYALSNGFVSSQHTASTLALLIALHEMHVEGAEYAKQIIDNAKLLAGVLNENEITVITRGQEFTRSHMFLIDTRRLSPGPMLLARLLAANISTNRIVAPSNIDALRLGVQEITRRGYSREEIIQVGGWLVDLLQERLSPWQVRNDIVALARSHRTVEYVGEEVQVGGRASRAPRAVSDEKQIAATTSRWVRTRLTIVQCCSFNTNGFADARHLGVLAGAYEHQTDSAGNISFCVDGRAYVTASGAYIKNLSPDDFVEMTDYSNNTLACRGCTQPSSEAYLHFLIRQVTGAAFVIHNHYLPAACLDDSGVIVLPPEEYGSVALAEAVAEAARLGEIIYVRKHGLVFWGGSVDECRQILANFRNIEKPGESADVSSATADSGIALRHLPHRHLKEV